LDAVEFRAGPFKDMAEVVRVHGALVAEVTSGMIGKRRGPSFMAGLLHAVGKLVLLQLASQTSPEMATVKRISQLHQTNLSLLVAHAWQLDPEILPAIAFHHAPSAVNAGPRDLCRILCIANIAVFGELDRRAHRNSSFIQAIAEHTRSRVIASKALNQAATAIDRMEADE
jgi:HD-like signal output (HDOD) protein